MALEAQSFGTEETKEDLLASSIARMCALSLSLLRLDVDRNMPCPKFAECQIKGGDCQRDSDSGRTMMTPTRLFCTLFIMTRNSSFLLILFIAASMILFAFVLPASDS